MKKISRTSSPTLFCTTKMCSMSSRLFSPRRRPRRNASRRKRHRQRLKRRSSRRLRYNYRISKLKSINLKMELIPSCLMQCIWIIFRVSKAQSRTRQVKIALTANRARQRLNRTRTKMTTRLRLRTTRPKKTRQDTCLSTWPATSSSRWSTSLPASFQNSRR